jgi:hypothetical protein
MHPGEPAQRAQRDIDEERIQRDRLVGELVVGRRGVGGSRQCSAASS